MSDIDAVFKAYDIRGTVPEQLDAALCRNIGAAFARFTGAPRVLIARDMRPSGVELSHANMVAELDAFLAHCERRKLDAGCPPLLVQPVGIRGAAVERQDGKGAPAARYAHRRLDGRARQSSNSNAQRS